MEFWLWLTYLSGEAWVLGYIVMLPVGLVLVTWYWFWACWTFLELIFGVGTFDEWFIGPMARGWFTQPFIYVLNVLFTIIPGVNFVTAFLLGWWAVADYYEYSYELFVGPILPEACQ